MASRASGQRYRQRVKADVTPRGADCSRILVLGKVAAELRNSAHSSCQIVLDREARSARDAPTWRLATPCPPRERNVAEQLEWHEPRFLGNVASAPLRVPPPFAPGARAACHGAVHLPAVAAPSDDELPPAPLAVGRAPCLANRPSRSGVDPDAKVRDNAREFGPRDRLVRVRCRGWSPKLCPAPRRSFLRCRTSLIFQPPEMM